MTSFTFHNEKYTQSIARPLEKDQTTATVNMHKKLGESSAM